MEEKIAKEIFENGLKYFSSGNLDEAEKSFTILYENFPNRSSISLNLAIVNYKKNKLDKAITVILNHFKIISDENEKIDFLNLLCEIYGKKKDFISEIKFTRQIIKIKPSEENYIKIFNLCNKYNLFYLAKIYLEKAYHLTNNKFFLLQKVLNFKYVYKSNDDYLKIRNKIEKNFSLNNLNDSINFKNLPISPTFIHSYNNINNKNFLSSLSSYIKKSYNFDLLQSTSKNQSIGKKIKIGFVSEFFTNHTIGKLFIGLIEILDKNVFQIIIFHSRITTKSEIKTNLDLKYEFHELPREFDKKVKILHSFNLDILFYPDVGMSTSLYYLIFIRFAKIQITSWGHPETTGLSEIDYFLTSDLLEENKNDESKYTEKIIYLKNLPMFLDKPKYFSKRIERNKFLKNLYCCPQSIYKLSPDFDEVLFKILQVDKKAKFIFIKDKNRILYKYFKSRLLKKSKKIDKKIYFVNPLINSDYIDLCGISSVLLDPIYFGAGLSFHESMVYGTPTISMPLSFLRSRIVLGAYKQMKIDYSRLIAFNIDDYVNKAVSLANNVKLNYEIRDTLKKAADKYLYRNRDFDKELNLVLYKLVTKN